MHFWKGQNIIVVFKDKIFEFESGDETTRKEAVNWGLAMGIPQEQLDFVIGEF